MSEDYGLHRGQPKRPSHFTKHRHSMGPGPSPYPTLRSRSSAPDFLETVAEPASPGAVDAASQKKPKTPPPISIRTRGSKKSRRKRPVSHHQGMPMPPLPGQHTDVPPMPNMGYVGGRYPPSEELSQSLRSIPVQLPRSSNRPNPQRPHLANHTDPRYHGRSRSHYVPRSGHGQDGEFAHDASGERESEGSEGKPPFRVLHSYNSPAYRGAPIWAT
jgi:hypothetical protein